MPHQRTRQALTIMVIPETGKRTLVFRMHTLWIAIAFGLFLAACLALYFVYNQNRALKTKVSGLKGVEEINLKQQRQIESLTTMVDKTEEKLSALNRLEQEIRSLTGDGNPSPSRSGGEVSAPAPVRGRGGPPLPESPVTTPLTIRSFLNSEAAAYLIPRSKAPAASPLDLQTTHRRASEQLEEMEKLLTTLAVGKEAVQGHNQFLAHRPTGLPISGGTITDRFGWRWSPFGAGREPHNGIDLAEAYWTPITATGAGVVRFAGWKDSVYGYTVEIDHGYSLVTRYAHMIDWNVKTGETIKRGHLVGWVGSSGRSTGPHVHYEVHFQGAPVDPVKYFQ
jgi:murein DD-endopeptidase MepM/ murein hydrolase activator NlpD